MVTTYSSDSDTESFHSFNDGEPSPPTPETQRQRSNNPHKHTTTANPAEPTDRFPPSEEASLLASSNALKTNANTLFGTGSFQSAIQTYDRALASCPNYLDYEIAVLRSNIAACYIKLEEWKDAIDSATKGLDCLERLETLPEVRKRGTKGADSQNARPQGEIQEDNMIEEVDDAVEARLERLKESGRTLDEVRKLQIKLLLRRAKARTAQTPPSWAALQGADEDYALLLHPNLASSLSPTDARHVQTQTQALRPQLDAAREREMAEMMKNLKGIGNSILKPFGLSTENFKFTKDEKSGGYSMGFEQSPGAGAKGEGDG